MTHIDVLGDDDRSLDDWLTDWIAEHERLTYIVSEVITVLALLTFVGLMLGGAWVLSMWWNS